MKHYSVSSGGVKREKEWHADDADLTQILAEKYSGQHSSPRNQYTVTQEI
jgi:hypothetical protein